MLWAALSVKFCSVFNKSVFFSVSVTHDVLLKQRSECSCSFSLCFFFFLRIVQRTNLPPTRMSCYTSGKQRSGGPAGGGGFRDFNNAQPVIKIIGLFPEQTENLGDAARLLNGNNRETPAHLIKTKTLNIAPLIAILWSLVFLRSLLWVLRSSDVWFVHTRRELAVHSGACVDLLQVFKSPSSDHALRQALFSFNWTPPHLGIHQFLLCYRLPTFGETTGPFFLFFTVSFGLNSLSPALDQDSGCGHQHCQPFLHSHASSCL